ncbi:trans-sulfuration enzyme [Penicillium atrosanguineum]|nr:trans-sulfuration enzyme [Penicillium atrosanguineum]
MSNGISTLSLHADDALNVVTDVAPPMHLATTFRYPDDPAALVPAADAPSGTLATSNPASHIYSRASAPNPSRFEAILSSILNGDAISYSSGLSALHAALTLLNPRRISVDLSKGDVVLLETPINPKGTAFDISAYAEKAHSRGAYLIVDSTFAPPTLQDPFLHGADLVMHSGSKYFGGHSDILCGVLATQSKEWYKQLLSDRVFLGSVMGNMESWLGVRSLRTLEVRVTRQSDNTTKLVSWLHNALHTPSPAPGSDEAAVQAVLAEVFHASLQPQEEWLKKQMPNGFGPVFSITMKEEMLARTLPSKLHLFQHATSLGGVESLIEWRTLSDMTVDRRLLRVSIGLENWEDLKRDFVKAFKELAGQ